MKGDVKAVRVTATGAVFAGRTRLRGIVTCILMQVVLEL